MRRTTLTTTAVALTAAANAHAGLPIPGLAVVDFEQLPFGNTYGPGGVGGEPVGGIIFSQNGVIARIADFLDPSGAVANAPLGYVAAGGDLVFAVFPTQALEYTDNIAVEFDFEKVGFETMVVTVEWFSFGGTVTLGVNNESHGLNAFTDAPSSIGGVDVSIQGHALRGGGLLGSMRFEGAIDRIIIGGQSIGVDNIIAVPAPGAIGLAAFGACALARRRRR